MDEVETRMAGGERVLLQKNTIALKRNMNLLMIVYFNFYVFELLNKQLCLSQAQLSTVKQH